LKKALPVTEGLFFEVTGVRCQEGVALSLSKGQEGVALSWSKGQESVALSLSKGQQGVALSLSKGQESVALSLSKGQESVAMKRVQPKSRKSSIELKGLCFGGQVTGLRCKLKTPKEDFKKVNKILTTSMSAQHIFSI